MVSIRLPEDVIVMVDELAAHLFTHKTEVMSRAIIELHNTKIKRIDVLPRLSVLGN